MQLSLGRELHGSLFKLSPGANFTYWHTPFPNLHRHISISPSLSQLTDIHSDRHMYGGIKSFNLLFQHRGEAKGGERGGNQFGCIHTLQAFILKSKLSLFCFFLFLFIQRIFQANLNTHHREAIRKKNITSVSAHVWFMVCVFTF